MTRAHCFALLSALVLVGALWIPATRAQPTTALGGRIADIVRDAGLGSDVGISVVETASGAEIYGQHADRPLNPASNMKVVTAAAALLELGPDFRMLTGLYGRVNAGSVDTLVLRGFGDPTLRQSDLVQLAEGLADRGVGAVGEVVVDGTYFDDQILPPAFEQQPGEMAAFRAAVGAVAVERASFVLRVLPGPLGAEARVRLGAPGYFVVDNGITTTDGGAPNVIASQRPTDDDRLALTLRGSVPTGILGVGYRRRVDNPLAHAGHAMAEALQAVGIRGRRSVRVARGPRGLPLLTSRRSPPMSQVLYALGKRSDNFVAEMVLKVLGAEQSRPGTSARGAQVLQGVLERAGVAPGSAAIVNGSGLFDGNTIAAGHLTKLLRHVYNDPRVSSEFVAQLSVGGVDGTLHRRLRGLPRPGVVRAKTGTLNSVIALSGYVLGPTPERTIAFSVLANGVRGRQGAARQLADRIAQTIAEDLY